MSMPGWQTERRYRMEQIAIYLRLSKEDEFVKDESNSITNQRAFIRGFINKNKELRKMSVVEFVDDGYSGKNMDRLDMQKMLEMVKRKQISCVIVKDFSRFSRDHIEQGKYIEQIFPFMGVRFIAINDNYDSADYVGGIGEIDVAFKGILYDFFSEEQSSKVSLTLDTKRGNGKYIATYAPLYIGMWVCLIWVTAIGKRASQGRRQGVCCYIRFYWEL